MARSSSSLNAALRRLPLALAWPDACISSPPDWHGGGGGPSVARGRAPAPWLAAAEIIHQGQSFSSGRSQAAPRLKNLCATLSAQSVGYRLRATYRYILPCPDRSGSVDLVGLAHRMLRVLRPVLVVPAVLTFLTSCEGRYTSRRARSGCCRQIAGSTPERGPEPGRRPRSCPHDGSSPRTNRGQLPRHWFRSTPRPCGRPGNAHLLNSRG